MLWGKTRDMLDTGHANISGIDQVEFIRKAGTQIKALHIADNEGTSDQHDAL